MIDFTRAFRHNKSLLSDKDLKKCDRQLLDEAARPDGRTGRRGDQAVSDQCGGRPVDGAARSVIVKLFEALAAKNGEAQVLY